MITCFIVGILFIGLSTLGFLYVSKVKKEDQEAAKIELLAINQEGRDPNESELTFSMRKQEAESAVRGDVDEIWWMISKAICWAILTPGIILVVIAILLKVSH